MAPRSGATRPANCWRGTKYSSRFSFWFLAVVFGSLFDFPNKSGSRPRVPPYFLNGTTTVSTVDTAYTAAGCVPLGKLGTQSQPYAPGGTVYQTTHVYDGLGRANYTVLPDGGSTMRYSYPGNQLTVNDPTFAHKTFTRDAFSNLIQVQEPDPALGTVTTTYTYDILNHLTGVSMPRGSNTQNRTFNYTSGATVGIDLLSATNPENGTVTYTYNSDHTIHTKTDAKSQVFTYLYDSYKRVTQISAGANTLRTFMYDTNTLDGTFSGSYTKGRLVAVQNAQFNAPGSGAVTALQFTEMYGYTQAGLTSGKRLQANETLTGGTVKTLNMDATYVYDIEGKMTSVAYPTTYAWNGSALVPTAGPTYTYSFDAMDRAIGLKDQNNNTAVSGVTYNAANQFLTVDYFGANETRTYNSMNQMTRLTIPGSLDISYNFVSGADNGKIGSQTDNISGETVTYQYDSLKRLISASGSGWSETYGYDAFGNLLSKTPTGGAPTLSQAVSTTTNQVVGQTYDANGNQLSGPLGSVTYDPENRILTALGVQYAYDSTNVRIWRGTISGGSMTAQEVYFYGLNGQKLATYALTPNAGATSYLADSTTNLAVFFRRKRIGITTGGTTTAFIQNRLGSQGNSYYPYGEDRGAPLPNDQVKFATYTRDSASGLDYADQRYFANNFGRFMSPDPFRGSGTPINPASWNRYSYVLGDPINGNDTSGLDCGVSVNGQTGPPGTCPTPPQNDSQGSGEGPSAYLVVQTDDGAAASPIYTVESQPAFTSPIQLVGSQVYETTGSLTSMSTWAQYTGACMIGGTGIFLTLGTTGVSASILGGEAAGVAVNLGGEGEVPGAINQQGPWVLNEGWLSSTGQTLGQLQQAGNQFVISTNTNLPFASGSVGTVFTNNAPIDINTWLSPGIQTSEIGRILAAGGQWINNGAAQPHP